MISRLLSTVAAAAMLSVAAADYTHTYSFDPIPTPTVTLPANAMQSIGCFETGTPLEDHGPYLYQSPGNCQFICIEQKKPAMALTDGERCWCGDLIPAAEWQTKNGSCDTTCSGTSDAYCGGPQKWWVVLTGTTRNRIDHYEPEKSSSSSSSSATPTSTKPAEQTVTATPSDEPEKKSSGPNKAGIAAGVVVGVVALAAIVGGVIFFLRQKKRKEIEEEHRRRDINSFMAGGKLHTSNSSMTDSRLDPEFMNRRQSNGSIADNEDYSRRILKVTNA